MLLRSKLSTARCNESMYINFLLGDPDNATCTRLSEILETVSHDSINRFLRRERFTPKDLFDSEKDKIELSGGILSVDDTVLDKPYHCRVHFLGPLNQVFWLKVCQTKAFGYSACKFYG